MTEPTSRTAEGLMKIARWTYGFGDDEHKARCEAVIDKIIDSMIEAGCSKEHIREQMRLFLDCYRAVWSEAKAKELSEEQRVH